MIDLLSGNGSGLNLDEPMRNKFLYIIVMLLAGSYFGAPDTSVYTKAALQKCGHILDESKAGIIATVVFGSILITSLCFLHPNLKKPKE